MGRIIDESLVMLELGLSSSPTDEERAIVQQALLKAEGAVMRYLQYDPILKSHTEYFPQADFNPNQGPAIWEVTDTTAYVRRRTTASSNELQLAHLPVRASTAIEVYVDYDGRFGTKAGAFAAATQQTEGEDFWPRYDLEDSNGDGVCTDGILLAIGRWPAEPGSVKVVYVAGYTEAELNGQDAVIDASAIMDAVLGEALRRAKKVFTLWKKNSRTGHNAGTITSESLGEYSYSLSTAAMDKLLSVGGISSEAKEKLETFTHFGVYM